MNLRYYHNCNITVEMKDIKCGLLSKHLFQRTQQHAGYTKPLDNNKFEKKILFPVITRNKKHSSKQVVWMINTLGKDFFAAATFKGLRHFFWYRIKNLVVYFGWYQPSLYFPRREDQKLLFMGSKFSFPYEDI